MKSKIVVNGRLVDLDAAIQLMDSDLREELNTIWGGTEDDYQGFVDTYCRAHAEYFGEEFLVS